MNSRRFNTACLCAVLIAGCTTSNRTVPRYAWETAQQPEYTEVFRGRWWNLYDRGLWHQLRGDYAAAEQDLRTAQGLRAADQLWPRTYGMHFLREYFPKRELGITLYHSRGFSEAAGLLEQSVAEQYSARGAYYLDLARAQILLASGADTQPPAFELISPDPDSPTGAIYTVLRGVATDDQYVAKVLVNGEPVDIRQSRPRLDIRHPIALTASTNALEVEVVDLLGKSTVTRFDLAADHSGPVISFDEYDVATHTIRGVVYDQTGVERLVVGGQDLPIQPSPDNFHPFAYAADAGQIVSGVPYRSVDANGNVTEGVITDETLRVALGLERESRVHLALSGADESFPGLLAQAEPAAGRFAADLVNLEDDQRFYLDTITVNFEVISPVPVRHVAFNGEEISIIPSRKFLRLSRSLGLGDAPKDFQCRIEATNDRNETASDEKTIHRDLNEIETDRWRLSLAFMTTENHHPRLTDDEARIVLGDLQGKNAFRKRFGEPVVRDPDALAQMLQEQELAQLSSDDYRLLGMQVVTADIFLDTQVTGTEEFVQIVLEGRSSTINRVITNRVEVAGSYDDLPVLIDTLATRLVQEFPRLQAPAVDVRGSDVAFTLTAADGIRPYYNCIFAERVLGEARGPFQPEPTLEPRGQGMITNVRPRDYSEGLFEFGEGFQQDVKLTPPYDKYFVITK